METQVAVIVTNFKVIDLLSAIKVIFTRFLFLKRSVIISNFADIKTTTYERNKIRLYKTV